MSDYSYLGNELDLFAGALRWKSYWRSQLRPFVRGTVLEVGAGNGNNTRFLEDLECERWVCIEPDRNLSEQLRSKAGRGRRTEVIDGILAELSEDQEFDTILYLDVLEHIENDACELQLAARHLRQGGHLVVLAPAHEWLFSPFDGAVGHFRRYSRQSLRAAAPDELSLVWLRYLDVAGLFASLGNRLLLKQKLPTARQLAFWDRYLVPISKSMDRMFAYGMGKSVLGVWRKAV